MGWGVQTREHTLPSGQVVTLRERFPATVLMRRAAADGDDLTIEQFQELAKKGEVTVGSAAVRIQDLIVEVMVVKPRVVDRAPRGDDEVAIDDIPDEDLFEIINLAMQGVAEASTFRSDAVGADGGDDGEGVGDDSEPPARAGRKPRGAAARS